MGNPVASGLDQNPQRFDSPDGLLQYFLQPYPSYLNSHRAEYRSYFHIRSLYFMLSGYYCTKPCLLSSASSAAFLSSGMVVSGIRQKLVEIIPI